MRCYFRADPSKGLLSDINIQFLGHTHLPVGQAIKVQPNKPFDPQVLKGKLEHSISKISGINSISYQLCLRYLDLLMGNKPTEKRSEPSELSGMGLIPG